MRFAQLDDWLRWLETLHPRAIDMGLERTAHVAQTLGINLTMPVLSVAGTNGKGSCVALASAIFGAAGYRVGTYTSPHLLCYHERINLAGRTVTDGELLTAFAAIDSARGSTSLSYFEFGTLAALWLFQRAELDVVVLEVGLGGRLDAVNIIDADVAIVSSIALDHEAWLGSDREAVGREKAGIFRAGRAAVIGDVDPPQSLLDYGGDIAAKLHCRNRDFSFSATRLAWDWRGVDARGEALVYQNLPLPKLLIDNAATVLQALACLPLAVSEQAIHQGLQQASVAGRCQHIDLAGVDIVLDVAHNPAAVVTLREHLQSQPVAGKTICVFAVMADKAIAQMCTILQGCFETWLLATLHDNPRAAQDVDVAAELRSLQLKNIECSGDVLTSMQRAMTLLRAGDRLVVFGSFFTVAEGMGVLSAWAKSSAKQSSNCSENTL